MPVSLRKRSFHARHYPLLPGHPREGRLLNTIWKVFFCPHVDNDVNQTVRNSATCASRFERSKQERHFQFFPASEYFEFIARKIFGLLPRTKNGKLFTMVMTKRYWKMTRAILTSEMTTAHVANVLFDYWIAPYCMPDHRLADDGRNS